MKVQITNFNREKQELGISISKVEGLRTAWYVTMTFSEFNYLTHRFHEIEDLIKGTKND